MIVATFAGCETLEKSYQTFDAAKADGVIQRGWIPEFLPASACDIRLRYNLDTNEIWLRFGFSPDSLGSLLDACQEEGPRRSANYPRAPTGWTRWWPQELSRGAKNDAGSVFEHLYRCGRRLTYGNGRVEGYYGFMVIDQAANTAFYWESGR